MDEFLKENAGAIHRRAFNELQKNILSDEVVPLYLLSVKLGFFFFLSKADISKEIYQYEFVIVNQ